MGIKIFLACLIAATVGLAAEKKKDQQPSKVAVTVKGLDAKKVYERLKDKETEKGAEEMGTSYFSKYGKGVQCLRWRGTKDDTDAKNYECTFEVTSEGVILEPNPRY